MKNLTVIDTNKLSQEVKDLVCDNCTESDNCKFAYEKGFRKSKCFEVLNEIKDELCLDDEVEYD